MDSSGLSLKIGAMTTAYGCAHHGELLQGVFFDGENRLTRGVVSMPCPLFHSKACFAVVRTGRLTVEPKEKRKSLKAAELTLMHICGTAAVSGDLRIFSTVPVGFGFGSSTADVTAAIMAIAASCEVELTPRQIAHISVAAEGASDATMFKEDAVLFASTSGYVIEAFSGMLPKLAILGFDTEKMSCTIDTLAAATPNYTEEDVLAFGELRGLLRESIISGDRQSVGNIALRSSLIAQKYCPKPMFDDILCIVDKVGALGLQIAHSGTIAGILFNPTCAVLPERIANAAALLLEIGIDRHWFFESQW